MGLFSAMLARADRPHYRLRFIEGDHAFEEEDPYRFPPVLGEVDNYLFAEGRHLRLYEKLGAHPAVSEGVAGTSFAVFAPNASRVSVVGDFNDWDGRRHPLRKRQESGLWEIFLPGIAQRPVLQIRAPRAEWRAPAAQGRPVRLRAGAAALDGLAHSWAAGPFLGRRGVAGRCCGHPRDCGADFDLRGASRLVAAWRRQQLPRL